MTDNPYEPPTKPAPETKSNTWLIVLVLVAALTFPLLCVCGGLFTFSYRASEYQERQAVEAQMKAVEDALQQSSDVNEEPPSSFKELPNESPD